jgi:hypothetical protein
VFPGLNLISTTISISSNATPGLRSLVVQRASDLAYANGFLEILPPVMDYNFDGLDDLFQRQHFPRFTAPEAGPGADPDDDGLVNGAEYVAGTSPVSAGSTLRLERVRMDAQGSVVAWASVPGRRYQLHGRDDVAGAPWMPVADPVVAAGTITEVRDPAATTRFRFYRLQVLP